MLWMQINLKLNFIEDKAVISKIFYYQLKTKLEVLYKTLPTWFIEYDYYFA